MSKERDKVKNQLFSYIADCRKELDDKGNEYRQVEIIDNYIELILSIPELAVVDRNAELPTLPALDVKNIQSINDPEYQAWERYLKGYKRAQQDMLKNKWVKEVD